MASGPRFPVYIPSKSRAATAATPGELDRLGIPFRMVVEEAQRPEYAARFGDERLITLDPEYQRTYDACMELPEGASRGSGPARNFIWDHAVAEGHDWHWIMDDNIRKFCRLNRNHTYPVGDGTIFAAMEDFTLRWRNVAMAGPQYFMFTAARDRYRPFVLNTRIFSCNLIRCDAGLRWRARYNEDLDLSIRMLKAGWCTVLFRAFLQEKLPTQMMGGGNTEAFYAAEGTRPKSEMIVRLHPDVCRLALRYGRWHHHADFSRWKDRPLIPREGVEVPEGDPYPMRLVEREAPRAKRAREQPGP